MTDWIGLAVAVLALAVAVAALTVQARNLRRLARVRSACRLIRYGVAPDLDRGGYKDAATAARTAVDAIEEALR